MAKLSEFDPITGWRLFYKSRATTLYYLKFTYKRKSYYKIGITTQTIKRRFAGEPIPYEIVWQKRYKSGEQAYKAEQRILKANSEHRYFGPAILRSGSSELFVRNVMKGKL